MKKTISLISIFIIMAGALIYYLFFSNYNKEGGIGPRVDSTADELELKKTDPKFKIIAVGDSLTAGYNLPLSDSYPKILEEKLLKNGKNVEVTNAGVSGETTAGLLERAQLISEQNYDILLITTGGNDAFRNLPIKNTKDNIIKTLQIFKQNIKAENIYLLKIEATANLGLSYRSEFNGMYEEIANVEKVNLLPFVVREVFLDSNKMLPDGIHPNRNGYEYIVDKYIFSEISKKLN